MAFDNVTFFELHLDSPDFGGGRPAEADEREPQMRQERSRRGPVLPIGFLLLLGVGAAVAARRMRRGDDLEIDLEDAEAIAVE
jgi:hypothetical protein